MLWKPAVFGGFFYWYAGRQTLPELPQPSQKARKAGPPDPRINLSKNKLLLLLGWWLGVLGWLLLTAAER
jgi:hypothetical protein